MQKFPVLALMVGYWALGNRQIFYNIIKQKTYSYEPLRTGHDTYLPVAMDHTAMIFLFLFLSIFIILFQSKYGDTVLKDD